MKLLLDTSFIVEIKRGNDRAIKILQREAKNAQDIVISILTKYELLIGVYYLIIKEKNFGEKIWLDEFLKWVRVVEITDSVIEKAAKIKAKARLKGLELPDMDLLIAVSLEPPVKLLTSDEDHQEMQEFLKEEGIEVLYIEKNSKTKSKN